MKLLHFAVFCFLLFVTACAHVSEMRAGIEALEGKNIAEATDLLGEPSEIKKGETYDEYIWDYQHEERAPSNVRTTSSAATPELGQEPTNVAHSTLSCFIRFSVDKKQIIRGWRYKGDQQACGVAHTKWIQKLKDYAKSHPKETTEKKAP